jgi:hypothetical protein
VSIAGSGAIPSDPLLNVAGGNGSAASNIYTFAINGGQATGNGSICLQNSAAATGFESVVELNAAYGVASGSGSVVSGVGGQAYGSLSLGWGPWYWALSSGAYTAVGDSQYSFWVPYNQTTDATPTLLGVQNGGQGLGAPNLFALTFPDFIHTCLLEFRIVARRTDVPGTDSAWEATGLVRGDGVSAYTWVGGSAPTPVVIAQDAAASTWVVTPAITSGNNGVQVTVTGQAAKTIQWTCTIKLYEVAG